MIHLKTPSILNRIMEASLEYNLNGKNMGMARFLRLLENAVASINISQMMFYGQRPLVIVVDEANAFKKMKDQGVGNCC